MNCWVGSEGVGSSGAEVNVLARLCMIWMHVSDRLLVRASDHPVLKRLGFDLCCCQTLRHQMNRCLYRQFIQRSLFWKLWPLNSFDECRNDGVSSSDAITWISTHPIQTFRRFFCFYFCFHELFELNNIQGTWVCIFSWLLVHGQATSAWSPLNSTAKHYKLAIQVSFISLWHLELTKSLAL
jgi:hypothetical protein